MARGWESKAVEAQQDEVARRGVARRATATEDPARAERRAALCLARARTEADLGRATRPAHRRMLEEALTAIDEQLHLLGEPSQTSRQVTSS
jgi:hypothetical protein